MSEKSLVMTAPVYGLILEKVARREVEVQRVTFVSAEKLKRVSKRLGLEFAMDAKLNQIEHRHPPFLFESAPTYAVLRFRGDFHPMPNQQAWRCIQEEFWLLASSFAFVPYRDRAFMSLSQGPPSSTKDVSVFSTDCLDYHISYGFPQSGSANRCDGFWLNNCKLGHFNKLRSILTNQTVANGWRDRLRRASMFFGQSYLSKNIGVAFAYNMIAVEVLLTKQGDSFPNSLIERIDALFGWSEKSNDFASKIELLYKLRCKYVHEAKTNEITPSDLYFSDELLQSLLSNLCKKTKLFPDIDRLIEFTAIQKAKAILNMPRSRFGFTFMSHGSEGETKAENIAREGLWI